MFATLRQRILLGLVIVIIGVVFWAVKQQAQPVATEPVAPLRVGYNVESINHAPIMVAYDQGIFQRHGVAVELVPFASGKEINQALAAGRLDIGSAGITNFLISVAQDVPLKVISPSTASPTQVYVRPNSSNELRDLVGKNVGVDPGSTDALAFLFALQAEGVDRTKIELLDVAKTVRPQALLTNHAIDAAVTGEYEDAIYRQAGAQLLPEWEAKGYTAKTFPRTVIAASDAALAQRPETVAAFIQAFIESERYIHEHPIESAQLVATHINQRTSGSTKFTAEEIQQSWQDVGYALWYPDEVLQGLATLAHAVGMTKRPLTLTEFWDQRFTPALKQAHHVIYETSESR